MGCGCKKKSVQPEPQPVSIRINEMGTPVVTQPAPQSNQ
jgi:hypothetical protein